MSRHRIVNKAAQILKVNDLINLVEYKIEKSEDIGEWHYNVGVLESLRTNSNHSHKVVVKQLSEKKKELKELSIDLELFEMEIKYIEGYIEGCIKVLEINRELLKEPENVRIVCFVQDDNIKDLMLFLFEKMGFQESYEPIHGLSIWVSSSPDELNEMVESSIPTLRYVILMNIKPSRLKTSMSKDDRKKKKNMVSSLGCIVENDIYKTYNTFNLVSKLDERFETASYGYVQNPFTVEALIQEITKNMKI